MEKGAQMPSEIRTPAVQGTAPAPDARSWFQREPCPVCGMPLGVVRRSKTAICQNCGFKDGCCYRYLRPSKSAHRVVMEGGHEPV